MRLIWLALLLLACSPDMRAPDGGAREDASARDGGLDAGRPPDAAIGVDAPMTDAGVADPLSAARDRLLATLGEPCAIWAAFDEQQRSVFLTLTHRLFLSTTPDGQTMLAHMTRLYFVLGGGADRSCGGSGNRAFFSMDAYLHGLMVDTWNGARVIGDGGGSTWLHTRDLRGPHDPFDASNETDIGLRCVLLIQSSDSRPPTGQAHFFLVGSEVAFTHDSGSVLPLDPYLLELDQDYNCVHDSNPTCGDFDEDYEQHYGDYGCDWVPSSCTPVGTGCYRGVE